MSDSVPEFIAALVKDPKDVPSTKVYTGWLGTASGDNLTRLYLAVDLSSYIEIPDDAILHRESIPSTASPLGGVYLWVKADAPVTMEPSPEKLAASFLKGSIQQDLAGSTGGAAGAAGAVPPPLSAVPCPTVHMATCPRPACCIDITLLSAAPCPTVHQATCPRPACCIDITLISQNPCPTVHHATCPRPACCLDITLLSHAACPTVQPATCPVSGGAVCPSAACQSIQCQSIACGAQGGGIQAFAAVAPSQAQCQSSQPATCAQAAAGPTPTATFYVGCGHTHVAYCPPTPATVCTQPHVCPSLPLCPTETIVPTHSPATVCTQHACPTQSPATVCTQHICPTPTAFPTPATVCTQHLCPTHSPATVCTQHVCPTATAIPTPATRCFICPPITAAPHC